MKKIIIRKTKDGDIYSVESPLRYANKFSEEEVLQKVQTYNESLKEGGFPYEVIEVDDLSGQIMEFLLGEGKYKRQHEISDLCESLNDYYNRTQDIEIELDSIKDFIYDIKENLDGMRKKMAEKFNVELDL